MTVKRTRLEKINEVHTLFNSLAGKKLPNTMFYELGEIIRAYITEKDDPKGDRLLMDYKKRYHLK